MKVGYKWQYVIDKINGVEFNNLEDFLEDENMFNTKADAIDWFNKQDSVMWDGQCLTLLELYFKK